MSDNVVQPDHYKLRDTDMEAIDVIHAALTPEEFSGFCKGNMLKYTIREAKKNGFEDIKKAVMYGQFMEREKNGWRNT